MSEDSPPGGRLIELYRTYIGEPDRRVDVYLGFGLFFAAIAIGVLALAAFVFGSRFAQFDAFAYREPAFALGMASLPVALLAIIVLLPVDRRGVAGGVVGGLVCFGAVAGFVWAYPYHWDTGGGPLYSMEVVLAYGGGLTILLGSTGAALVAYHVDRARPGPADVEPVEESDPEETFSDEEIREDIDEAMADVELNWGGVEKTENTRLSLSGDFDDVDTSGLEVEAKQVQSGGVDDQVAGLKTIKGGEKKTARSTSTVDDQTSQLAELRQRKREEEASADDDGGVAARVEAAARAVRSRLSALRPR